MTIEDFTKGIEHDFDKDFFGSILWIICFIIFILAIIIII